MNSQEKMTLTINSDLIKISDLTKTLKDIEENIQRRSGSTSSLCISEVRKGSMIFDLVQLAGGVLPLPEVVNAFPLFIESLKQCKDALKSWGISQDKKIDSHNVETLLGLCNVLAQGDGNASLYMDIKGNVYNNCTFELHQEETKGLKLNGEKYLKEHKKDDDNDKADEKNNVVIYFTQTNILSEKADKAICESIDKKAVKILIPDKDIKNKILENPYGFNFIVNLKVHYKKGKPILYEITQYIEKFSDDSPE